MEAVTGRIIGPKLVQNYSHDYRTFLHQRDMVKQKTAPS